MLVVKIWRCCCPSRYGVNEDRFGSLLTSSLPLGSLSCHCLSVLPIGGGEDRDPERRKITWRGKWYKQGDDFCHCSKNKKIITMMCTCGSLTKMCHSGKGGGRDWKWDPLRKSVMLLLIQPTIFANQMQKKRKKSINAWYTPPCHDAWHWIIMTP